ncbi:MAG: hypothetical protein CM15mP116_00190 [Synechococcus sp.]|nr:MAG: hypothetical protein CM15mP116_00190 [Synechococcus sp.]
MEKSGYVSELIADGTDEAEERRRNLQELVNAAFSTRRRTRRVIWRVLGYRCALQ